MLGLIERTRTAFRTFIEQRDDLIAMAPCQDADTAVVLKLFRDIEDASDHDLVLCFADNFISASPYVSVAVERLAEQHRIACQYAAEHGKPPLPPVPDILFDAAIAPGERLFEALSYASSLVPRDGDHRLVWIMCPGEIADRDDWLRLVRTFLPDRGVEPWMAGVRLVFRDQPGTERAAPDIVECPRVRTLAVDFGQESIERGLEEDAQDESLSEEQRLQALLSSAVIDSGHGRAAAAATKFESLLGHYQQAGNLSMQAFVINAFGDLCWAAGDEVKARHWYECAVLHASEAKDALVLAAVTKNLGELAFAQQRYAEAEEYFIGLDQLAAHLLQPETKVSALEWRGLSLERMGRDREAADAWESAVLLCRNIGLPELLRINLEHLERIYQRTRVPGALRDVRNELAELAEVCN